MPPTRKPCLILCLALLLLAAVPAAAGEFTVGISRDFPPFSQYDNGRPAGLEADLASNLCAAMNAACRVLPLPAPDLARRLAAGGDFAAISVLLAGADPAPGAEPGPVFTRAGSSFLGRTGSGPVISPQELDGTAIGCLANSAQQAYLQEKFASFAVIRTFPDRGQMQTALREGGVELIFDFVMHNLNFTARHGDDWEIMEPFEDRVGLRLATRIWAAKGNRTLARELSKGFEHLRKVGVWRRLVSDHSPLPLD